MHITRAVLKAEAKKQFSPEKKSSAIVTLVSWAFPSLIGASGIGDGSPFSRIDMGAWIDRGFVIS